MSTVVIGVVVGLLGLVQVWSGMRVLQTRMLPRRARGRVNLLVDHYGHSQVLAGAGLVSLAVPLLGGSSASSGRYFLLAGVLAMVAAVGFLALAYAPVFRGAMRPASPPSPPSPPPSPPSPPPSSPPSAPREGDDGGAPVA